MGSKSFENVKSQVSFCGLWCGSCMVGNGTLRELAKRCGHIVGGYGVDEWGARDFDGKEFMKGFASIQSLPVCQGCLKGGGNGECKVRPCASKRKVSDCIECGEMKTCMNSEALQKVRSGAYRVGMVMKMDKGDSKQLIKGWTAEFKSKCPGCGA